MKRSRKLFILLGALVLLAGLYALVTVLTREPEEAENADSTIAVMDMDADEISSLTWTANGVTLTLLRSGDTWYWPEDEAFPLDQSYPKAMLGAVSYVSAGSVIEEGLGLSEYGLDEPALTVEVSCVDGSGFKYTVGDYNDFTSEYYLCVDDDGSRIYPAGSGLMSVFGYDDILDLANLEDLPDMGDLSGFSIETTDKTLALTYDADAESWTASDTDGALDAALVGDLTGLVTGLEWISCVSYDADEAALRGFGLSEPAMTVTVNYYTTETADKVGDEGTEETAAVKVKQTFVLQLGAHDESGSSIYARLGGSPMVYRIDAAVYDALAAADGESLQSEAAPAAS